MSNGEVAKTAGSDRSQAQAVIQKLVEVNELANSILTLADKIQDQLMGTQTPWDGTDKGEGSPPGLLSQYQSMMAVTFGRLRHTQEVLGSILKETST